MNSYQSYSSDYGYEESYKKNKNFNLGGEFNVRQPLPTGAYISFNPGIPGEYDLISGYDTTKSLSASPTLTFYQPIQPFYILNQYKYTKKGASLDYQYAEKKFNQLNHIIKYSVSNTFFQLAYLTENLSIYTEIIRTKTNLLNTLKTRDALSKSDLIKIEIGLEQTKNEYLIVKPQEVRASNSLKELLYIPQNDSISISYEFVTINKLLNKHELITQALENRWDIKLLKINKERYNLELDRIKSGKLPTGGFTVRLNPYGRAYGNKRISYSELFGITIDASFDRIARFNDLSVGHTIRIPILDGQETKNRYQMQKLRILNTDFEKQSIEENIKHQVNS